MNNYKFTSANVLRVGISLVMLWFGSQQLLHPEVWTTFLPGWTSSLPVSAITFIYMNGVFEILAGILLIFNVWRKVVSALLGIHMLGIVFSLGYGATAMRDFAIFIALLAIFLEKDEIKQL